MEPVLFLFFLFLTAAILAVAAKTIRIVPQATVMIVERLGRFHKVADSGLQIFIPFIDKPRGVHWVGLRPGLSSIDLREHFLDMPPQSAITRDNVQIVVDAVVYWQITDPLRSVYEVVTNAEGLKTSAILRAEGAAEGRLLAAEAEAEAVTRITEGMAYFRLREADAESGATTSAARTASDFSNPAHYLIISRCIEGLRNMANSENAKVIFMPAQSSRVLGSAGAIIEMLSSIGERT